MTAVKGVFRYVENTGSSGTTTTTNNIGAANTYNMPILSLGTTYSGNEIMTGGLLQCPIFNLPPLTLNSSSSTSGFDLGINVNTKHNFGTSLSGYNAQKGSRLARYAMAHQAGSWNSLCATYVKNAIQGTGLGEYKPGHGFQMASVLNGNPNFKRVSNNLDVKSLPAGCILVYGKGVAGYSSSYGHVEITTGNGTCVSDNVTHNPRQHPSAIFIPV